MRVGLQPNLQIFSDSTNSGNLMPFHIYFVLRKSRTGMYEIYTFLVSCTQTV